MEFIHQVEPYISENTIKGVNEYLSSGGWLTEFKQTREFEQAVAKFVNAKHGTAVTSGTAALYLSLRALNIGPGDAVVVPNYTMIATINAVVWAGAEPIIADISPDTLCLDLNTVKLNKRLAKYNMSLVLDDAGRREKMAAAAKAFYKPEAAQQIARDILSLAQ